MLLDHPIQKYLNRKPKNYSYNRGGSSGKTCFENKSYHQQSYSERLEEITAKINLCVSRVNVKTVTGEARIERDILKDGVFHKCLAQIFTQSINEKKMIP